MFGVEGLGFELKRCATKNTAMFECRTALGGKESGMAGVANGVKFSDTSRMGRFVVGIVGVNVCPFVQWAVTILLLIIADLINWDELRALEIV